MVNGWVLSVLESDCGKLEWERNSRKDWYFHVHNGGDSGCGELGWERNARKNWCSHVNNGGH